MCPKDSLINCLGNAVITQNADSLTESIETAFAILILASFLFVILFASFLTFGTRWIVKLVYNSNDFNETITLFADRRVIYEIALAIMGLLLIICKLPDLAFKLGIRIQQTRSEMPTNNLTLS